MESKSPRISYVALARLPTGRAHGYAIMKMCEQFTYAGAQVKLLVPRRRHHGILGDEPFSYYGIKKNFTLRKLWASDFLGKYYKSRLAFFADQLSFLLSVYLENFGDSLVYTRDYQVALIARAGNIVIEVHSIPENKILFLKAAKRAKRIIVISKGLKRALIEHGVPSEKLVVAPDAVDLSEFTGEISKDAWRQYAVDPHKKIVLYAGHFYGWKGADTFAATSDILSDEIQVVLMGGWDEELKSVRESYPKAHVVPYQAREKIPPLLKAADLLVLPNSAKPKISAYYTSPLKLFQYMASGVPIVASDLPSIKEILSEATAFWFEADNERSLAAVIEYSLNHPEEAATKAARAKEEVKKYTWEARARTILDCLR